MLPPTSFPLSARVVAGLSQSLYSTTTSPDFISIGAAPAAGTKPGLSTTA